MKKPVLLMILDGWGIAPADKTNAAAMAKTPNLDSYFANYPHTTLEASGKAVGLPAGQIGNSEVGHLNIGAGRIIYQSLTRIDKAIEDGDLYKNEELSRVMDETKQAGKALHLLGLLSDGGVHSHIEHLLALICMAKVKGLTKIYVHAFLDGRDVGPKTALEYIHELEEGMAQIGVGKIATVSGRYYAMDRDKRWERVERAYKALVLGEGGKAASAAAGVEASYAAGVTDEFVEPFTVDGVDGKITAGDGVIFFNFRPDRARELTRTFCDDSFDGFERGDRVKTTFVCFTEYDDTIQNKLVAFHKVLLHNTFGEYLAAHNMTQARIAETEKYAHVTFFFNGGVEEPNKNEDRILVKSPAVATYDLQPEMSAPEVSEKLNAAILGGEYDVIIINFANPDMVGHTGIIPAAIQAVETVDKCVGAAVEAIDKVDGVLFICADHGNAEQMINYETGAPHTAHTTNPVPFILYNYGEDVELREGGCLADIAPTLLEVMGLPQPKEMTGKSLIENQLNALFNHAQKIYNLKENPCKKVKKMMCDER